MTAEEFVKQHMPTARAERQVSGMIKGMQTVYWLIRESGKTFYFCEGKTESNAWVNAKKKILNKDI